MKTALPPVKEVYANLDEQGSFGTQVSGFQAVLMHDLTSGCLVLEDRISELFGSYSYSYST
jgi:hypothetical protein